jgi:hypothetical protein
MATTATSEARLPVEQDVKDIELALLHAVSEFYGVADRAEACAMLLHCSEPPQTLPPDGYGPTIERAENLVSSVHRMADELIKTSLRLQLAAEEFLPETER